MYRTIVAVSLHRSMEAQSHIRALHYALVSQV
jgi:hypothetical protein